MSEKNMEYLSLCSSCKNAGDCIFQKDLQRPALYCEEFEIDISPPVKTTREEKVSPTVPIDADGDSGGFIGLCSNCDNRRTCAFPIPEGGIWHCEEYR